MDSKTLFGLYDAMSEMNMGLPEVPSFISSNLRYPLRPYQNEAISRWSHYMDVGTKTKTLPVELLFNMATGSGKTLIMAALIIDLYRRGYRNFIYFVNSTNIIEKTRDNFKNSGSKKYLFADNIMIDGQKVEVRDVESFSDSDKDAINIVFTTIQQLHMDLNNPGENKLSYSEFEDMEVVLIGDEAHHNNTETLMTTEDKKDNASWESTVNAIMRTAKNPILLEFTATIDLEDASIYNKYKDRIIYKYDLKRFREDGYSKDVMIYHVDSDLKSRMLQAIIISQYRKKVALRNGIYLKPVVMFKSSKIADNKENFELFKELIKNLDVQTLKDEREKATSILKDAFDGINLELTDLVEELKNDFMEERLMIIDGNTITADKQLKLNSLEDTDNEVRAIFAVDMLNEGWDVLNLFDIVRLYDTRDAKNNKPGKTTIREAQLIGRGARYFPFVIDNEDEKYVRKFDNNESEELRLIEQLHYHSAENPKYIQEIRQALITSGIIPADFVEWTLHLKPEFKKTKTYTDGVVFVNERQSVAEARQFHQANIFGDEFEMPGTVEIDLPTNIGKVVSVFGDTPEENETTASKNNIEFEYGKIIAKNITRHAMALNKTFKFCNLEKKVTGIQSAENFMDMMNKIHVIATGVNIDKNSLTPAQKLFIAKEVLHHIEAKIAEEDETFVGTREFVPRKISEIFKDVKRKYAINNDPDSDKEFGQPQMYAKNEKYRLNLKTKEWYAYDENYGTSEEKSLVVTFDSLFGDLAESWDDIYLLRNEKAVTIYAFDDGHAFEPDYLLLANDKETGNHSWQIFIEPKGGQLLESDKWKQDFLMQITEMNIAKVLADTHDVRIIGLPFYNEDTSRSEFIDALKDLTKEA